MINLALKYIIYAILQKWFLKEDERGENMVLLFVLVVAIQQNINNFDLQKASKRFHLSKLLVIMLHFIMSSN